MSKPCVAINTRVILKPNSIPPQIPNFSVAEFEGWEFSVQKEINTFSPNTEDDDVFKSLFTTRGDGPTTEFEK